MKRIIYLTVVLLACLQLHGQDKGFTKEDTLRGSITPERSWWDLTYYHLDVSVKPEEKFISGHVAVHYKVVSPYQEMQIDLQPPLSIEKVTQDGENLSFTKKGANAYIITLKKVQKTGSKESVAIQYSGNPIVAKNPPWQGGFQWTTDKEAIHLLPPHVKGWGPALGGHAKIICMMNPTVC